MEQKQNRHTPASALRGAYRYPGVQPFSTSQADVFFGREEDTKELYRLIRREPLTVLYGKSGLGKSSLLNAGIIPQCERTNDFSPVAIRFGAWTEGTTNTPLSLTKQAIIEEPLTDTFLRQLLPEENALWYYAKRRQLHGGGRLLLIFDQFEELFTYPAEAVRAFKEELSELLHTSIPLRFLRMAEQAGHLTEEEEDLLEEPLDSRLLFAIRSDRMHLLHPLANRLPGIFDRMYELRALREEDARRAIQLPAQASGPFRTPPFEWGSSALDYLLDYLQDPDDEQRVEGILLQLLCQYFEEKKVEGAGKTHLEAADLGSLERVVEQFYSEKVASIGTEAEQLAARRLLEEGLVMEGENIRLSLHEAQIFRQYKIPHALLVRLVDSRLLRAEPFLRGGYSYELAHDRLVPPVLAARQERKAAEAEAAHRKRGQELAAAREKARQEQLLRKQAQAGEWQAKQRTRLALGISAFALFLAVLAGFFYTQARSSAQQAQLANREALAQKEAAEQALADFQQENAAKERLKFESLQRRANTILEAAMCPEDLFQEMRTIAQGHPDSLAFNEVLQSLYTKNPSCQ